MKSSYTSRLLGPDLQDCQIRINRIKKTRNLKLITAEQAKMNKIRTKFNLKSDLIKILMFISQGLVLFSWTMVIYKFNYNLEDYPQILTGGFLWFKDLSVPDPYFIVPILNALCIYYNVLNNNMPAANEVFIKVRKYMFLMPLFSFPIMCTFPSGMTLYFFTQSLTQSVTICFFNSKYGRKILKVPASYLEDTKLHMLVSGFILVYIKYYYL